MLTELLIRGLAVIDELRIPLESGLTVVTGETGAGKSLLIDALALALGDRADVGLIRHDAQAAEVAVSFTVTEGSAAAQWLDAHGLSAGTDCLIRRLMTADRSRAFINGTPVPVQRLRELGDMLIDLHTQHEHHALMRRETQRLLLDAYAGAITDSQALTSVYARLTEAQERLHNLENNEATRAARESFIRYQLDELEQLNPTPGEWETLGASQKRFAHAQELGVGIAATIEQLIEGDHALGPELDIVISQIRTLSRHDPRLVEIAELLTTASLEIAEAARSLSHVHTDEMDPVDLAQIEERLGRWHHLARKHKVPPENLVTVWTQLQAEYASLSDTEGATNNLRAEIEQLQIKAQTFADALTKKRVKHAPALSRAVTKEMQGLGLSAGRFEVSLTPDELTGNGCQIIDFLVTAQKDSPPKPLAKVASGGELSRISLALQVVLADVYGGPTLVFDEVDVGIGGAVAEIVGQRLRALGEKRQILCITHLPQVAAQGNVHVRVHKAVNNSRTQTSVSILTQSERIEEIARMLGGVAITARTRALAQDMLHA